MTNETIRRSRYPALVVLIATLAFALSPLATAGFNGFTSGQFPVPQNDPPVQPAGYAFSIAGVIYVWLIIGAGYGFWRAANFWREPKQGDSASCFNGRKVLESDTAS